MDGQLAAKLVVRLFAQQIEKLAVDHGNQEIERRVRIRHDKKQRRFLCIALLPATERVQLQLVIRCQVEKLLNIEGRKPCAAAHQDRFCGLALWRGKGISEIYSFGRRR